MRRLRQGLTYANVMATIAVFVALGGTGVAAVKLSKNSVNSNAIKNGQVKNKDLASNAVTSSKVKNGSLLTRDFKSGQLPKGAKGDPGTPGQPGAAGPSNGYFSTTSLVSADVPWVTSSGTGSVQRSLSLPAGNYILNASAQADNADAATQTAGCSITISSSSASVDDASMTVGPNNGDDKAALALTGGATLASPDTVKLDCSASSTNGSWQSSSLTAIKVASLN
jgi:hypothetical protein